MKILFVTDLYPINTGEATTPVTLHNFVFEWQKFGHEVTVIKPNFVLNSFLRGKPFYFTGFYEYDGVKVYNVNYFLPFCFNVLDKIPKQIKFSDFDIIIAHMPSGLIWGNKVAKIMRKPLVCGVHCSDIEVLTNPTYSFYFKEQLEDAYNHAKNIACRSDVLRKKFNKLLPKCAVKTFVASSGVNSKYIFDNKVSPYSFKPSPFIHDSRLIKVVTCANLIKRKNVDKLVLAIKDFQGFELNVIGEGLELNALKSIGAENVKFLGRLPHEKVLEEMRKSDVFVLPSENETFGMVYLEAMASGCVTVCAENDGIDGIIKDGQNGFLTEPTEAGIRKTLLKIRNFDNIEQVVKNSIQTAKDYSQENCADNYLQAVSH